MKAFLVILLLTSSYLVAHSQGLDPIELSSQEFRAIMDKAIASDEDLSLSLGRGFDERLSLEERVKNVRRLCDLYYRGAKNINYKKAMSETTEFFIEKYIGEALSCYEREILKDDPDSNLSKGNIYYMGMGDVKRDDSKALESFMIANQGGVAGDDVNGIIKSLEKGLKGSPFHHVDLLHLTRQPSGSNLLSAVAKVERLPKSDGSTFFIIGEVDGSKPLTSESPIYNYLGSIKRVKAKEGDNSLAIPAVVRFSIPNSDDFTCSGAFIGGNKVVTAHHCIEEDRKDEYEVHVEGKGTYTIKSIIPRDGVRSVISTTNQALSKKHKTSQTKRHPSYDWTILTLNESIGDVPPFVLGSKNKRVVILSGYREQNAPPLFTSCKKFESEPSYEEDGYFRTNCDTLQGQSGAPIFYVDSNNKLRLVGIHSGGGHEKLLVNNVSECKRRGGDVVTTLRNRKKVKICIEGERGDKAYNFGVSSQVFRQYLK